MDAPWVAWKVASMAVMTAVDSVVAKAALTDMRWVGQTDASSVVK